MSSIFKRLFSTKKDAELSKKEYAEHDESLKSSPSSRENFEKTTYSRPNEEKGAVLFGGGQAVRTPPKKPVSISEAGILAEKLLKGE